MSIFPDSRPSSTLAYNIPIPMHTTCTAAMTRLPNPNTPASSRSLLRSARPAPQNLEALLLVLKSRFNVQDQALEGPPPLLHDINSPRLLPVAQSGDFSADLDSSSEWTCHPPPPVLASGPPSDSNQAMSSPIWINACTNRLARTPPLLPSARHGRRIYRDTGISSPISKALATLLILKAPSPLRKASRPTCDDTLMR